MSKYYIVWEGHHPGVYDTWEDCKQEILHFSRPKYKSFKDISREEAEELFNNPQRIRSPRDPLITERSTSIITPALAVDASTIGNPGQMEYRGVWVDSGDIVFSSKIYPLGTNNIGEFLAIVHAMGWMLKKDYIVPVYSDSLTAITWVKKHRYNTQLPHNKETEELFSVLERARLFLENTDLSVFRLIKWDTEMWGEIPADYGRK